MKQRVVSALIAIIISIPLILLGGIFFLIGISIIGILGLKELNNLRITKIPQKIEILSYISLVLLICGNNLFLTFDKMLCLVTLLLFLPIIFLDKNTYNFNSAIELYASIVFLGFSFNIIGEVRNNDIYTFLYLVFVPMFYDTTAYFIGKNFGKTKLLPKVSPGKTIEGTLAGIIVSAIFSSIFYLFEVDPAANILNIILTTIVLSIIGQLGDLFFSSIKRYYGVKDFSNIMPGHGGILDRLDSTIFVFMCFTLFF